MLKRGPLRHFEGTGVEDSLSITPLSFPLLSSGWTSFKKKKNDDSVNPCKERDKPSGREFMISILCNRPYPTKVSPLHLQKQERSMSAIPGHTRLFPMITLMPDGPGGFYSCSSNERQEQMVFSVYEFSTSKFVCSRVMPTGHTQMKIRVHQTWRS